MGEGMGGGRGHRVDVKTMGVAHVRKLRQHGKAVGVAQLEHGVGHAGSGLRAWA